MFGKKSSQIFAHLKPYGGTHPARSDRVFARNRELVHELNYHLAQASNLEANIGRYGERTRHLLNMIDCKRG